MSDRFKHIPLYDDLPLNETLNMRYSWGVFGKDDELGTLNFLDAEAVKRGAAEIKKGKVFNLSLPLNLPDPTFFREGYRHHIIQAERNVLDDYLDNFFLQASSQWDALKHVRAREFGFYNGYTEEEAGVNGTKLGIDKYAEHGIVGRAVLADVAGYMERKGTPIPPRQQFAITPDLLDEVLKAQGSEPEPGDILLIRTGFLAWYLQASYEERVDYKQNNECPGLTGREEMARWLWNKRFAAVCADNAAVERIPGTRADGSLHRRLLPMLGFAVGELFNLEELAKDCAEDGRYFCHFTGVPLNLPNGVGSPANAIAIK